MKSIKLIHITAVLLLLLSFQSQAQYIYKKTTVNKKKKTVYAIGGGLAFSEYNKNEVYGGNFLFEMRKPFWIIAKKSSMSFNISVAGLVGNSKKDGKDELNIIPLITPNIAFNAFSQSHKKAAYRFGGFIAIGLAIIPGSEIEKTNANGTKTKSQGIFGPSFMFGPRFRFGKLYMDTRIVGAVTMAETAFVGLNLVFSLDIKKKKWGR